ncbi:hypothetical protein LEP1GSC005_1742 [Leptospira santarosai str. ST188]|nr:hypothetical protein LEP1GSC005_1742 [Leptospira santarosai str. ST188]EMO72233.1 hypothetical protein LEP1GSC130_0268 [Leptospira santarosai str. 200403458]EMO98004.1 hypothetical protein LEP1GSC120_1387 [Leptospira santarosai str. 200702252]
MNRRQLQKVPIVLVLKSYHESISNLERIERVYSGPSFSTKRRSHFFMVSPLIRFMSNMKEVFECGILNDSLFRALYLF